MTGACPVQRPHTSLSDLQCKVEALQGLSRFGRSAIRPFLGDVIVESHLVDDIDKGLGVALLETIDQTDGLPAREDRLDERCEFTLRVGTADQTAQGSFTRG